MEGGPAAIVLADAWTFLMWCGRALDGWSGESFGVERSSGLVLVVWISNALADMLGHQMCGV